MTRIAAALLACACTAIAATPGAASSPSAFRTETLASLDPGARAAQGGVVLRLRGSSIDNRLRVFLDPDRRLVFVSPEGFPVPDGADGNSDPACSQDSLTRVSCEPGHVAAVVGTMGRGNDRFVAAPNVPVFFGAVVGGRLRTWSGGPGRDRLVSGLRGDALDGGPGPDLLRGRGGADLLRGLNGHDRLLGGPGGDVLLGGRGRDRLGGGPGRDLCGGGPGRDRATACALTRGIP